MQRVLHILPHRGGGGETVVDFLSELQDFDHRRIYLSKTRKPLSAPPSLASGFLRARREARHADLLHVLGDASALLCAPLLRSHRSIWSTQGLHLLRRANGSFGALVRHRMGAVIRNSTTTICSSRQELDELARLLKPPLTQKLVEIPNGIPLPALPTPDERTAARCRLGLDAETTVALYLGELEQRKRPLDAVAAVEATANQGVPVVLLIAGQGPMADELAAREGNVVRVLGFQSDPAFLFAAADIFLMPSEREGLALALIEAMAHGLAIVASTGPGNPDAIADAGILYPVGDIDALSTDLSRLALDPRERQRLGNAARIRAEAHFTLDRFLADSRRVFSAALK